jgi:uncharacterized integral membrane protein (TIGR00698 family)
MSRTRFRDQLPGLAVLALFAVGATALAPLVPSVTPLLVAVGLGALVANTLGTPEWAAPGIALHKLCLEVGIVLLGARLTLGQLVDTGPTVFVLAVLVVVFAAAVVELLARAANLGSQTGSLLAAGSSVCGVSAVVAVAGGIDADETDIAYAVATILLFDAVTLVAFPVAGDLLGLSDRVFGVWAGLSMFSTGPVAAAGFTYSPVAGEWATVTKLVRNSLIGAVVVAYSLSYSRMRADTVSVTALWTRFPKFVVGFLAVATLVNLAGAPPQQVSTLDTVSDWLFTLAFVGLGFEIRLEELRRTGVAPVVVVFVSLLVVSAVSLVAVVTLL